MEMRQTEEQTQNTIESIELAYWHEVLAETILRSGGTKAIAKCKQVIAEIKAEQGTPLQA